MLGEGIQQHSPHKAVIQCHDSSRAHHIPDISKYLDYLQGAGYIEFTEEKVTAYNAYANDAVIKLTKEGVDLAEGTIEDNGVDI